MDLKIWKNFLRILAFRRDLINIIRPFLEKLENSKTNETYQIQDKLSLPILKSLTNYQLKFLHEFEIISDEIYTTLIPNPKDLTKSLTPDEKLVSEIIIGDKLEELQSLLREKDIKTINTISTSFQNAEKMSIPILNYAIIHNATKCFKFLLINDEDPRRVMEEQNPDIINKKWVNLHRFQWDCMATAIFYGRVEIIKMLEDKGMEKGNPENIKTAIYGFRNALAKNIIEIINEKDHTKIQELLNKGLIASINAVNISGILSFLKRGANVNSKDFFY